MAPWLALLGLILDIIGVGLLIRDELTPLATRVRQSGNQVPVRWWTAIAFWLARRFGSANPQDQESYVGESLASRLGGFFLILLGFLAQAIGLVIYVESQRR